MINNAFALGDTPVATVAPQTSLIDKISNVINKVVVPAATVYGQVKQTTSSGQTVQPTPSYPWSTQTSPGTTTPAATPPADNTGKILLIGGAVVLGGLAIYFVTKKKVKK
jgi:hypothetical protein